MALTDTGDDVKLARITVIEQNLRSLLETDPSHHPAPCHGLCLPIVCRKPVSQASRKSQKLGSESVIERI